MHTRAALTIATGQLNAWTRVKTVTWFGGFNGGVAVLFADGDDNAIAAGQTQPPWPSIGVDGTAIGSSDRTLSWSAQMDPADAQRVERMSVFHTWNPVSFRKTFNEWLDTAERVVSLAGKVVDVAKATSGAPSK
jgi:hypothetical protein